ncbi:MAG: S41 family peptidase [Gemmataceae bacterium]
MARRNLVWLLVVPGLVALGLAVTASAPPPDKDYQLVRTIVDVLAEVDKNYVRELSDADKKRLVEDMINGGLERLDPHSQYFNDDELANFETQSEGQYGGIGIILAKDPRTRLLQVETPMPNSPAYDAGLQAGDYILKIGDKSTADLTYEDARKLIKGPPGTPVTLTIARTGATAEETVTLNRAVIVQHPVAGFKRDAADPAKWDYLFDKPNKIAAIRLSTFSEKSADELKAAVEQAEKAGAEAVVLDLRDNPGGLLSQAAAVADLFLTEGPIVSTKNRRGGGRNWSAKPAGTIFEPAAQRPMAVLVNRGSASAAEIVAAALQDNGRAVVVGERSYGKGSVQKVFELPPGQAAVKLTTEEWLRANGQSIHRWPDSTDAAPWGVKPDKGLEVELTLAERIAHARHLRQLEVIPGKNGKGPAASDEKAVTPYVDKVLQKAIDHLKGKKAA